MVEDRAGTNLESWWRRGLEGRWGNGGGKGRKRAKVMVEERD